MEARYEDYSRDHLHRYERGMSNLRGKLDQLKARIGSPEDPTTGARWEAAQDALSTLENLLHEHADEIDRDHGQRLERGEDNKTALISAKRSAWKQSEEGRAALRVVDGLQERERGE